MKIKFSLFICLFCLLSPAYGQRVLSLHQLFVEQDATLVPEIEGVWRIPDFDMTISFQKAGDNFYLLKYGEENNPSIFEAVFVKIKDEILLDISGSLPDTLGDDEYRSSFVSSHSIYKVRMTKETLELFELNHLWFYNYAKKDTSSLKYEWIQNGMLLTLNTDDLKSFLIKHYNDPGVFDNSVLKGEHVGIIEKPTIAFNNLPIKNTAPISNQCNPEFPHKDGWLGGDGDVSVPLNEVSTLFIFSDTYVGRKEQLSRVEPGLKMVSNTVAIQTCLPNGKSDVNYFWNNMYSENPQPIFKSFTNRYIFWVQDAFLINESLYVLLEKVGDKQGASSEDNFGFSLLGFTLAKVSNPTEAPNEWKIELIPLPDFGNPFLGLRCHVVLDGYIYFFVSRFDKAQVLIRKQINFIEKAEKPYEYYALNKTWKEGLQINDMDTIVNGFRSNTVNYHPEMKQWVMICDVKFLDNKIMMRTAPALTGPWSEEKIIYEIPEVTPGNSSYSKTNFCYLARECIQNYDSKNHKMVLTYDINNSDSKEISSNPKIYTPRVITIPLRK